MEEARRLNGVLVDLHRLLKKGSWVNWMKVKSLLLKSNNQGDLGHPGGVIVLIGLIEDGVVDHRLRSHPHIRIEIEEMIETEVIENENEAVIENVVVIEESIEDLLEIEICVTYLHHQIKRSPVEVCLH